MTSPNNDEILTAIAAVAGIDRAVVDSFVVDILPSTPSVAGLRITFAVAPAEPHGPARRGELTYMETPSRQHRWRARSWRRPGS